MEQSVQHRPPSYYVKKRLFGNKPAMFGLVVIAIAHVIAALGYLIMPDPTPDATDGHEIIEKKPPFFSVWVIKFRKQFEVESTGFLERMFNGEKPWHSEISPLKEAENPKDAYEFRQDSVFWTPYGERHKIGQLLLRMVRPMYIGASSTLNNKNYEYYPSEQRVAYVDLNNQRQSASLEELQREFEQNNVERRTYLFGTDASGRDILSRMLLGTRISLSIGFVAVLISLGVGVVLGALGGYFGGWVDSVILWLMTVVFSIPGIMLVIVITMALDSRGIWAAFVAVGLTMWVDTARIVRGQIVSVREKLFVEAATAFGFSRRRIIFRHILPNIVGPIIVVSTSNFASAILIEAGLSFLGLGVQPPTPSWGGMIHEGYKMIGELKGWHITLFPSLSICLMVLSFNLLGNGLRDAYDPKTMVK